MNMKRLLSALVVLGSVAVAGCTPTNEVMSTMSFVETPAPALAPGVAAYAPATPAPGAIAPRQGWDFAGLVVNVPRSLTTSEAAGMKPRADIVWREEPVGDRHAQVERIVRAALEPALSGMRGETPVQIVVEVTRFHALTERARYTIGGEHEIELAYVVRHAESGEILVGPTPVDLTFRALGGRQAVEAENQGLTQRVRISQRIAAWARETFPSGVAGAGASAS